MTNPPMPEKRTGAPRRRSCTREGGAAGQMFGQLGQRRTGQLDAVPAGAGTGDRHDPVALRGRGPLGTPAPSQGPAS